MTKKDFEKRFLRWLHGEELLDPLSDPDTAPTEESSKRLDGILDEIANPHPVKRVEKAQMTSFGWFYSVCAVLCCLVLLFVMLLTVANLPRFSELTSEDQPLAKEYLTEGTKETGAVNIVAAMILNYRAFDTLGESFVLFTALTCVTILMRIDSKNPKDRISYRDLSGDPILGRGAKFLAPMILLYGIYIMINGHLSPGGGFSGGAISGAGLILMSAAYGFDTMDRFFTNKVFNTVCGCALGFYALSKAYSFFCEANGLPTHIPQGIPGTVFSAGLILPLDLAVGLVVTMTMFGFYCLFRRGKIGK